ncbi:aminopeptidase [Luteolibacter yonseiensis]|uniref:Aminopeptidase n=1 Tax=Luteolibacter yonseiensis TaxID=1144680 RepID=A0A934VDS1_9BACT|nr:aminopeptidase [Luteolibacter yonseiensis]MBK1818331.1 aminopeptidase [Luteolibacter yonseiensis]
MLRSISLPLALCGAFAVLTSCQTVHFYQQALGGQWEILRKSKPNGRVIASPETSPVVRRQLIAVERIRQFASDHLSLPGDESYGKYADLGREHVVWVLYAAPEFSLEAKNWHYPAVGEMDYRGYFREEDTVAYAKELRAEGYDVFIGGVDAYSTLGWFHDPVLNTFVRYPDIDLAETIFHELTHRRIFRWGDTVFNESLANTVAEEGVRRWLRHEGRLEDLKKYEGRLVRRREFYREIERSKAALEKLYSSGKPAAVMRGEKAAILGKLRDSFRELRRKWGGHGLEEWLKEDINNGHIVSLKLYAEHMPEFEKLLAECDGDLDLFYQKAGKLKLDAAR